ncbi:MAG: Fe-S cluster assembly protein SufD [Sulfurovum sp.]|nr:Fe-S cluster assembly protein SufD [Sulfurovum sp.]
MKLSELRQSTASEILDLFGADESKISLAEELVKKGLPSKKSEEYRYADIESALSLELEFLKQSMDDIEPCDKLIITDGVVTHAPESVSVRYTSAIDRDMKHFDPLYYLGHIASEFVLALEPRGDESLKIVHRLTKIKTLIAYRVALFIAPNTQVNIYESFDDCSADGSLVLCGYDAFVDRDATLKLIKNQTLDSQNYRMIASHRFKIEKSATIDLATFDFGSASSLQTMKVELGERAHLEASHLLYASGSAKRGTVSKILHIGEHSTSNQQAKSILADKARGIFDALIKVEHSAKYTKAHQGSKAILLEMGPYMASKPQLEIYIDELEASHGSTTGQLDSKQLFYLRSRGISEVEAKKMLIQAFANELIDKVAGRSIQEQLHISFDKAFYGEARMECIDTCDGCEDALVGDTEEINRLFGFSQ